MYMGQDLYKKVVARIKRLCDIICFFVARIFACGGSGRGVWLIAEKIDEARDNGYWFYKFMVTNYPQNKIYYVITKNSADYDKVKEFGEERIIIPNSWRHRVLFWSVEYNVCSQPQSNYFSSYLPLRKLRKKYQKTVFLQHGIIKDNLSHGIDASTSGIDIFITSSQREREAVMQRHGYSESSCLLTGLCRFDNLPSIKGEKSHTILVMPTFRHWIMSSHNSGPTAAEIEIFRNDEFCKAYNRLLSSPRLAKLLDQYNYRVLFYPHYLVQPFLDCFTDIHRTKRVILASRTEYDVQSLLIESDILITDFSSVFFDFAYMKKPEIFYQFDEERYRDNHYEEGYFQYKRDAFGPVFQSLEDVLSYLELCLGNNSCMENVFVERVNQFFAYTDHCNCERTLKAILQYKK